MRLSTLVFSFAFLLIGAGFSVFAAISAVNLIEETTETDVRRALSEAGYHWADVEAEGLQVFVIGNAPSEAMRFKAKSAAGTVVDAARVIDQMSVVLDITPKWFLCDTDKKYSPGYKSKSRLLTPSIPTTSPSRCNNADCSASTKSLKFLSLTSTKTQSTIASLPETVNTFPSVISKASI